MTGLPDALHGPDAHWSDFRRVAHGDAALGRRWRKAFPDVRELLGAWPFWADKRQLPPPGDWRIWLMMAGRGFGKTRAGAEWIRSLAERDGSLRIALVAATRDEARAVMVEGESGLLNLGGRAARPRFEPSRGRLIWRSGAEARLYSGENPEGLRGPQHHVAWCDELAKWAHPEQAWNNLMMGLRLGLAPRVLVTTTPRPIPLLRRMIESKPQDMVVTGGRTSENLMLSPRFRQAMADTYGGTRLGRQELDGELIAEVEGALWSRALIERCRVSDIAPLRRVVVGVDPPAGTGAAVDACGIIVAGLGEDGRAYVLEDATVQSLSPEGWAMAVASAARRKGADRVIVETNNGGAMVESVLRAIDATLPIRRVHASRGKIARAEPIAALYEQGKVAHMGALTDLEDQLAGMVTGGGYQGPGRSPDRADALVWALSALMLGPEREPRVRRL